MKDNQVKFNIFSFVSAFARSLIENFISLYLFKNGYDVSVLKDYVYCTNGITRKNNKLQILERNIGENHVI